MTKPVDTAARRLRARNVAVLGGLIALAVLFYLVTVVRLGGF